MMEIVAPADGQLSKIYKEEGDTVGSNEAIAEFSKGEGAKKPDAKDAGQEPQAATETESSAADSEVAASAADKQTTAPTVDEAIAGPAARRLISEKGLDSKAITATGKGGRITKEDVLNHLNKEQPPAAAQPSAELPQGERPEKRVPMTRLRATIASRLVKAQQTAAMLTTYNEVNMQPIMSLREKYKEAFQQTHDGVKLGFMSFFVKASVEALKRFPAVNASIDGDEIVYHGYQDIGVAVSTDKGLVVPVLRNAETMGLAEIEAGIATYGKKARDGKLGIDEMTGGTFTISNGGVFGSLLSTPILNPPQTAILGMHKIQERPMAVAGQVEILPMMYLALSYDHRMIDGREAVQFLVTIKELLEDPARILLQV